MRRFIILSAALHLLAFVTVLIVSHWETIIRPPQRKTVGVKVYRPGGGGAKATPAKTTPKITAAPKMPAPTKAAPTKTAAAKTPAPTKAVKNATPAPVQKTIEKSTDKVKKKTPTPAPPAPTAPPQTPAPTTKPLPTPPGPPNPPAPTRSVGPPSPPVPAGGKVGPGVGEPGPPGVPVAGPLQLVGGEGLLDEYYLENARERIRGFFTLPERLKQPGLTCEVAFTLARDGTISQIEVLNSTGNPSLDEYATTALKDCQRLAELPEYVKKDSLRLSVTFDFSGQQ